MLLHAMASLGRPMLMAMGCGGIVRLREALYKTLRVRNNQRDRE
jgi:hypothetical protein